MWLIFSLVLSVSVTERRVYIYIVVRKSEEKRRGGGEKLRVVSVEGARTAVKKELVCARRRGEKKVVCVRRKIYNI